MGTEKIEKSSNIFRKSSKLLLISLVCFAVIVVIAIQLSYHPIYIDDPVIRVEKSKYYLSECRKILEDCYKENDEFPDLEDNNVFIKNNIREYISKKEGCLKISQVLNDKGGWFYNSETGEIYINLTKPLKEYFPNYEGDEGSEIPSTW